MFIRNGDYYDYPFREALYSALPVADKIVVCECFSDKDNTFEELQKIQAQHPGKIEIVQQNWVDMSAKRPFEQLSTLGNYAAMFLDTDWKWQLQADEVIHEDSYEEIRRVLETAPTSVSAMRVKYTHMLGNFETEFDFCYTELIRIARRFSGWELIGDACQLDRADKSGVIDTNIRVFHYGKVHSGKTGWTKEWDFQQLFTDIGFPDPKMKEMEEKFGEKYCDYVYLFESSIREGKVRKFTGTHPLVMSRRIAEFKEGGWEQFVSRMKEGLKV